MKANCYINGKKRRRLTGRITFIVAFYLCIFSIIPDAGLFSVSWAKKRKEHMPSLQKSLKDALEYSKAEVFLQPSKQELLLFRSAVRGLLYELRRNGSQPSPGLLDKFNRLGMQVVIALDRNRRRHAVILEKSPESEGKGVFVFPLSPSEAKRIFLQAPHAFTDMNTGRIARNLYENLDLSGLFMNSLPRDAAEQETEGEEHNRSHNHYDSPADMAHNRDTFFQIITEECLKIYRESVFVQIHGFEKGPARNRPEKIDVIISFGMTQAENEELLERIENYFVDAFGSKRVAVYGKNIDFLGALTNVQGQAVNSVSDHHFIHLELSYEFRRKTMESDAHYNLFSDIIDKLTYE